MEIAATAISSYYGRPLIALLRRLERLYLTLVFFFVFAKYGSARSGLGELSWETHEGTFRFVK